VAASGSGTFGPRGAYPRLTAQELAGLPARDQASIYYHAEEPREGLTASGNAPARPRRFWSAAGTSSGKIVFTV
jgi:hypothetical protein